MRDVIYIACDDSGAEAKSWIIAYLRDHGYECQDQGGDESQQPEYYYTKLDEMKLEYKDFGTFEACSCDYPLYGYKAAKAVADGECDRGILICGSGIGMSIAANKFRGVRASVVTDDYSARLTRRHNDSNILCLGGRMVGRWMLLRIVETWLTTEYDGGHHQGSLDLLAEMERAMLSESVWCPPELPYEPFNWDPKQTL